MELPKNRFKQGLATGETQYGLWLGLPDNSAAEIAAAAGFDWLLIDGEHAPFDLRTIMSHLQAMAPYDVAPVVRCVEGNTALIKQLLDIGVQTLLVPMVEDAEQAKQLVKAVRYPPDGIRGLGTSLARAARWNQIPGYLKKANDEICLIVQVETASAMENLDEILAIEGVDGVFIGPSDLSASMGYIGDAGNREVVDTINKGLHRIRTAGKYAGLLCPDPSLAESYIRQGANFVGVGVDTLILANETRKLAQRFKQGAPVQDDKPQAGY
ncbi:4-hydroxy-2-oxoheptanedioate aldolase [Marinobacter panjinensis]|uniref:4-hydroxy-2-oxoheptanedioate aldolase n=1 Tax=Marinobacter panjinensis TaxID=2576384 RepID=A0A4U6R580_9GAMM|nr:4-hydroxy-2-oxoheptanedioate aldolase [Marinobacter panjinensis]MCR8913919.1 4-hydroxy-2-oxoheptanedioate aldolase [Marinobacter panjinensis]TKV67446.1 4-hydroxy-2-oxoheptanedioate aldolase [Marinobacter panjinensis]